MKRQATDWEKIFSKHISDKDLVTKIYKEVLKLNNNATNNPILKWVNDLNRYLTKENIQITNKHIKKCSTSFAILELQIKTIAYHYTILRMVKIQKTNNTKCW